MCTVLLPPGGYPIAVNKYINININNSLQEIRSVHFVTCEELLRKDEQVGTNYQVKSFTTNSSRLISVKKSKSVPLQARGAQRVPGS